MPRVVDALTSDAFYSRLQRRLADERRAVEIADSANVHQRRFYGSLEHDPTALEARASADLRHFMLTGDPGALEPAGDVEFRDLNVGTGSAGGYVVAQDFNSKLVEAEAFWSAMRQAANVYTTTTGAPATSPAFDDSATSGAILGENVAIGSSVDVTLTNRTFNAFDYVSPVVKWSIQADRDVVGLEDAITWLCGQRLGRIQNTHFTTGTGSGQPLGLFTAGSVPVGATSAAPTTIAFADLVALYLSVDAAYWPTSSWMMSPTTALAVRGLLGTNNIPLFPAQDPLVILGRPVIVNPAVVNLGANALAVGFGDVARAYTIRDVGAASFHRLDERYMSELEVGAFVVHRSDGQPSGDQRAFKTLQQHA
jgi:HK97 family phage major capsid protein